MSSTRSALVVGLAGVTNGGKTTMCHSLQQLFFSNKYNLRVVSIQLDDYFRSPSDPHHVHLDEFDHHDWDSLCALDTDRFLADIESNRSQCDLLLVEGFLIFNIPKLLNDNQFYDLMYYFDLPYEECLRRRSERNYDPPDPKGYFERHVWQVSMAAKKEMLEHFNNNKLVIADTTKKSFDKIKEEIIKDIEVALKEKH